MKQSAENKISKTRMILVLPLLVFLMFLTSSSTLPLSQEQAQNKTSALETEIQEPVYPGGKQKLYRFIATTVRYPLAAHNQKMVGYVVVQATINAEGKIGDFKMASPAPNIFQEEVIRVLKKMRTWSPATQGGAPISSTYLFPVHFTYKDANDETFSAEKPNLKALVKSVSSESDNPVYRADEILVVGYKQP
ncbi:TonB family protein [Pontibacter sp. 13R65]|uniref:TonB family protein n=1 Tax=Pontibacter sp. 13R65 TaxID=3127458 RepID=UPI00301DEBB1